MKRPGWIAVVVLVIVATFFVMRRPGKGAPLSEAALLEARAECGHKQGDTVKIIQIHDLKDVPEFHDCQRFMVKQGETLQYDSLFAIFAADSLRDVELKLGQALLPPAEASERRASQKTTGVTRPGATPQALPTSTRVAPQAFINSLTAGLSAVVYATGAYPALGIEPERNCLYVWRYFEQGPPQVETWTAKMVPKGLATSCPDVTVGRLDSGTVLRVKRTQVAGFTSVRDYPPVARWDWDATNNLQYIGIGCGDAWCEIYKEVLESSPALPAPSGLQRGFRRVRLIKGWHDQQYLATVDAAGKLVPSRVMGTILPDTLLGELGDDGYKDNKWTDVAQIVLVSAITNDPVLTKYEQKFNFGKSDFNDPTRIQLKGKVGNPKWKAKIKSRNSSGSNTEKGRNVTRVPVSSTVLAKYTVPGVARWRWMKTDEGTWTRCSGGCCEMSDYTNVSM